MRSVLLVLMTFVLGAATHSAHSDTLQNEFKQRIQAALEIAEDDARVAAVTTLFYRGDLDDWSESLVRRTAERVAKLRGRDISFATLPATVETLHVINGYEYRPNLEPLGYVVFTDPAAAPGNNTKIFYGRPPGRQRYHFPSTVRRLVNPDAPPDKQLQMLAMGAASPPVTFEGWCDIALSNNTVKRVRLHDQNIGNQTLIMRGQSIRACEVKNTSGRGSLSLRLYEDDKTIFERRVEMPQNAITYHAK